MSIKILIERRVADFVKEYSDFTNLPINKQFLYYSIFNIYKYSAMEYEEILDGIIDGTNDYGIDAIFIFSSGELIDGEEDLKTQISKEDKIKIQLIQTTRDPGFAESVMMRLKNGIEEIFNLERKLMGNKNYVKKAQLIRSTWEHCSDIGNIKGIEIEILYVSLSDVEKPNSKVATLENKIYDYCKSQELRNVKVKYIGMHALHNIVTAENYEKYLTFKDMIPYAESYNEKAVGYYGLVRLKDFLEFISNDKDEIEERYFEGNVRDYYGMQKKVNEKIYKTLTKGDRMNFWCFNNGITIICENSSPLGKKIKLFNFSIVNGCQTSHVIDECREYLKKDEHCEIMVKVIQTKDAKLANDIIDATNSQTSVSPIFLHSNDKIQETIEEHFLKYPKAPLYYERRINYYKRRHKSQNRIVAMLKLFQVFYSIFGKRPSAARGRPTESFQRAYGSVFNTSFDYDAYLIAYLVYMKIHKINRDEATLNLKNEDTISYLIIQYGIFHTIRIALPIFLKTDSIIKLQNKDNVFTKNKKAIFSLINDEKKLKALYNKSATILYDCIDNFRKKDGEAVLHYNLLKSDDIDKEITSRLGKLFNKSNK